MLAHAQCPGCPQPLATPPTPSPHAPSMTLSPGACRAPPERTPRRRPPRCCPPRCLRSRRTHAEPDAWLVTRTAPTSSAPCRRSTLTQLPAASLTYLAEVDAARPCMGGARLLPPRSEALQPPHAEDVGRLCPRPDESPAVSAVHPAPPTVAARLGVPHRAVPRPVVVASCTAYLPTTSSASTCLPPVQLDAAARSMPPRSRPEVGRLAHLSRAALARVARLPAPSHCPSTCPC